MDLATPSGVAVAAPEQEAMKGLIAFEPLGWEMEQHLMGKCLARSGGDGRYRWYKELFGVDSTRQNYALVDEKRLYHFRSRTDRFAWKRPPLLLLRQCPRC